MYWLGFKKNIHEAARILQIATNFQSSIETAIYLIREISEDLDMEAVISVGASSAFSSSNQGEDLHKMQGICLKLFKPLSLNPPKMAKYTIGQIHNTNCLSAFDHFVGLLLKG